VSQKAPLHTPGIFEALHRDENTHANWLRVTDSIKSTGRLRSPVPCLESVTEPRLLGSWCLGRHVGA